MATFVRAWLDGPELYEQYVEDGRLWTVHTSRDKAAILRDNAAVRSIGARKFKWGRPLMQIPFDEYKIMVKQNPDLEASDGQIKKAAWRRMAAKYPALCMVEQS